MVNMRAVVESRRPGLHRMTLQTLARIRCPVLLLFLHSVHNIHGMEMK